jgi:hypothetical protein
VLLINAVIAVLGMLLALLLYQIHLLVGIQGFPLILLGSSFFFVYLFVSDVIEDKLIEYFDKTPSA